MRKAIESQRRSLIHLAGEASQWVPPEQDIHEDNLIKEHQAKIWLSLSAAIITLHPPFITECNWKKQNSACEKPCSFPWRPLSSLLKYLFTKPLMAPTHSFTPNIQCVVHQVLGQTPCRYVYIFMESCFHCCLGIILAAATNKSSKSQGLREIKVFLLR